MVKINFPRTDLDQHHELAAWRLKQNFAEGDWTELKEFLAEQPRVKLGWHPIPKCWYTELPQGDNYALDVEHFRPKSAAEPLNKVQVGKVEALTGAKFYQNVTNTAYSWLEFNYRNYRLTSALPNRGGGKHLYFPVAFGSNRLTAIAEPWVTTEYNLLLDPTNDHDANLLVVLPNGDIEPRAPKTPLTLVEFNNYVANWRSDGFNYLRAVISIILYRLDNNVLIKARREIFEQTTNDIDDLLDLMNVAGITLRDKYIAKIFKMIVPSAPFSLAARSALLAYIPQASDASNFKILKDLLLDGLSRELAAQATNWNNP
ncbi:MAG: hypothetical protein JSU01_03740 [Bacteroidetes bacterium]|nr:hypothetical protein [Bacteroidota bacterium]